MPAANYRAFLGEVLPGVIRDPQSHIEALKEVDRLMALNWRTPDPALGELIDLFATLISRYEDETFPFPGVEIPSEGNALEVAIAVACEAHHGQTDKAGVPYILHPLRVMMKLDSTPDRIAAVLHDVVEDGSVTLDRLLKLGFKPSIVRAIDALTRRQGEPYDTFIDRVEADPIATRVKICDLEDNLDVGRLAWLGEPDLERVEKYHRSLIRLRSKLKEPRPSIITASHSEEKDGVVVTEFELSPETQRGLTVSAQLPGADDV